MRVNLRELIAPCYDDLADDVLAHGHTHYALVGGRGSLKSSTVSLLTPLLVMQHPARHAVVIRKVGNTLRDSVYAQYCWALDKLGVAAHWTCKVSPMEMTYRATGQKILFRGADDPMKIKSIKAPFGYIAVTHFEEFDQFRNREELRAILQSTMRGGATFWNFESCNPPISRRNWANRDLLLARGDRLVHRSCYLDAPPEWLGDRFLAEAEALKAQNERAYRHEYLGEPTGSGGQVFENLVLREIPESELTTFGYFYQGIDWGYFPDPLEWIKVSYDSARRTLYLTDEYRVRRTGNRAAFDALVAAGRVTAYDAIIADSAEPKSIADFREYGAYNIRGAIKGAGSVNYSRKWLQSLCAIVIDPARCPGAAKEFAEYEYECLPGGDFAGGYPDAENHAIDAVAYATETIWRRRGQ
ncbi:MAG: PBSX family phage terminase large subunit [Clostridia bacterium]